MSYQYKGVNFIKIENTPDSDIQKLWITLEKEHKGNEHLDDSIDFHFISNIEIRLNDFEEVFRNAIIDFCKTDLQYIYFRGIYDMFTYFYKKSYSLKPLHNKDDVSKKYKASKNKILKLLDTHYIPMEKREIGIPELDLSTKEIEKFMRVIDGIISDMEHTPSQERQYANEYARTAFSWIRLAKTTQENILTTFRKLHKDDPLLKN